LVTSCYGNWNKLQPDGPLWLICRLLQPPVKILVRIPVSVNILHVHSFLLENFALLSLHL